MNLSPKKEPQPIGDTLAIEQFRNSGQRCLSQTDTVTGSSRAASRNVSAAPVDLAKLALIELTHVPAAAWGFRTGCIQDLG